MEYNALVPIEAAGALYYAQRTRRRLFLLRSAQKHRGTWGLVGGKLEGGETLLECILRETQEEVGCCPSIQRIIPLEKFTSVDERFRFHTFVCVVAEEFVPVLNYEHLGYAWLDCGVWPKPLHPGLWSTISFSEIKQKIEQVEAQL